VVAIATFANALFETKRGQVSLVACGQQIDADTNRLDLGGGFKNTAGDSAPVQRKPERQAADAGADDNDFVHVFLPVVLPGMKHD